MPTSPNNIQQYPTFLTKVKLCPTSSNNTQHHPTMPNMGGQTIPTFIPNIVGICWAKMLASFGQGLTSKMLQCELNSKTMSKTRVLVQIYVDLHCLVNLKFLSSFFCSSKSFLNFRLSSTRLLINWFLIKNV